MQEMQDMFLSKFKKLKQKNKILFNKAITNHIANEGIVEDNKKKEVKPKEELKTKYLTSAEPLKNIEDDNLQINEDVI